MVAGLIEYISDVLNENGSLPCPGNDVVILFLHTPILNVVSIE